MGWATRTTRIHIQTPTRQLGLEIFDTPLCRDTTRSILAGKAYPRIDFLKDVQVVVDIGANVGAASVYFALQYPAARLLAFEPCPQTYRLLSQNLADLPNARTFNFGLFDRDCQAPLYLSREDAGTSSVRWSYLNSERSVEISLKNARYVLRHQQIEAIDVLKIDTEGCELPILHALADLVEKTRVIYLEYHDEADRLAIDALLRRTHILAGARLRHPHRGELCYVAYHSYPSAAALDRLRIRSDPLPDAASAAPKADLIETSPASSTGLPVPYEVAVVVPTILRPSLKRAVQSVFDQQLAGPAQLLIGVDRAVGDRKVLEEIRTMAPEHWVVSVFDPGYSTSARHGGLHAAKDCGALRTILSYTAHSCYVAYLDDDNWWSPEHLPSLLAAVAGHDWAYSRRWFVDPDSLQPLGEDTWESVGPGNGIFRDQFGGFVDPNTLLLDKRVCEPVLRWWAVPLKGDRRGMTADRSVFHRLRTRYRGIGTGQATCYYHMNPHDGLHRMRLERLKAAAADRPVV
jgi:FkbM family methyltransferase